MNLDLERQIRTQFGGRCSGCGSIHRCRARFVVPLDAGGQATVANAAYLCRVCDLATSPKEKDPDEKRRLVNLWVSRELHRWVKKAPNGSSLARHLVGLYLAGPEERFDDLPMYQDTGMDVRLFVYLDGSTYDAFKARVAAQKLTVTDAITGLFRLYQAEMEARAQEPTPP